MSKLTGFEFEDEIPSQPVAKSSGGILSRMSSLLGGGSKAGAPKKKLPRQPMNDADKQLMLEKRYLNAAKRQLPLDATPAMIASRVSRLKQIDSRAGENIRSAATRRGIPPDVITEMKDLPPGLLHPHFMNEVTRRELPLTRNPKYRRVRDLPEELKYARLGPKGRAKWDEYQDKRLKDYARPYAMGQAWLGKRDNDGNMTQEELEARRLRMLKNANVRNTILRARKHNEEWKRAGRPLKVIAAKGIDDDFHDSWDSNTSEKFFKPGHARWATSNPENPTTADFGMSPMSWRGAPLRRVSAKVSKGKKLSGKKAVQPQQKMSVADMLNRLSVVDKSVRFSKKKPSGKKSAPKKKPSAKKAAPKKKPSAKKSAPKKKTTSKKKTTPKKKPSGKKKGYSNLLSGFLGL